MDQREMAEAGKSFHPLKSLFNDSAVRSGTSGFSINDRTGNYRCPGLFTHGFVWFKQSGEKNLAGGNTLLIKSQR